MSFQPAEQRRFQVFVSSTYLDLQEERQLIVSTLLESDAFPAGMELFPASDDDAWTLIRSVIDDSDYYLVVIGGKYGSIDPEADISFTEKEYDYAVATGKPVMAFLHGDPEHLTVEQSELDPDRRDRLEQFRTKVTGAKHVKFWTSGEELAGKVALSFNKMTRNFPVAGWVRGDQVASAESRAELAEARARIAQLEAQLATAQTQPRVGADQLAQGSDPTSFLVYASARFLSKPTGAYRTGGKWLDWESTWDDILGIIAPGMLIEVEEQALKKELNSAAMLELFDAGLAGSRENAIESDSDIPDDAPPRQFKMEIDDEAFGTIVLQLKALGLIDRSERRRSVNDTGTYWRLTPQGEQRAIQVRAIRRVDDDPGAE